MNMKRGKKYLEAAKLIDRNMHYVADEALGLVKKTSFVSFDASVEAAFRLNLDPRQAEQNLRGAIVLPHGTGKTQRVIVIAEGEQAKEAEAAGADKVGGDELIQEIGKGWLDFDVIVATPAMMGKLGKLGRLLGPKGLMPNPKTGTVTNDVDKVGNIHVPIGKVSFEAKQLVENLENIYQQLLRIKPNTLKGVYVKNITVSSSMGPGVKVLEDSLK
jgi:large subunit ribosomal protein L1